jgi:hypothetical protein
MLVALTLVAGRGEAQAPFGYRGLKVGMSQDAFLAAVDQGQLGDDVGCAATSANVVTCRSTWLQADDGTSRKVRAYFHQERAYQIIAWLSQRRVLSDEEQRDAYGRVAAEFGTPFEVRRGGQVIWTSGTQGASWWSRVFPGDEPGMGPSATVFTTTLWDQTVLAQVEQEMTKPDDDEP